SAQTVTRYIRAFPVEEAFEFGVPLGSRKERVHDVQRPAIAHVFEGQRQRTEAVVDTARHAGSAIVSAPCRHPILRISVRIRDLATMIVTSVPKRCTLLGGSHFSAAGASRTAQKRSRPMPGQPIEVARNQWGAILHHPDTRMLELKWFAATRQMSDDDFKATLELYTSAGERLQPITSGLIDATEFFHTFADNS